MSDLDAPTLPGVPNPRPADPEILELFRRSAHADSFALQQARRVVLAAIDRRESLVTDGGLSGWLALWRAGLQSALQTASVDVKTTAQLARAALRLDGQLTGPELRTSGVTVAVGDGLIAKHATRLGHLELDAGVPAHVIDVDQSTQAVTVDIPTIGASARVAAGDDGFRSLTYAYAEPAIAQRGLQRDLPDRDLGISW